MCNECSHCEEKPKKESVAFASSKPYPPVQVCERNQAYGRMMLDNMGGNNSEMSAVSLYLYNNLLIDEDERLSNIFSQNQHCRNASSENLRADRSSDGRKSKTMDVPREPDGLLDPRV